MPAAHLWERFWAWYERNYVLNVAFASVLFLLQIAHLTWLGADPVAVRLTAHSLFTLHGFLQYAVWFVDYTEIPALIAVSLVYVNELRHGLKWKPLLFLLFLNSQWLHIFWITDEYVAAELGGGGSGSSLPGWLAWVAILIDYLELPVIYDTLKRLAIAVRERRLPSRAPARG
jgi:hypothetical protein